MIERELSIERILDLDMALKMADGIDDLSSGLTTMRLGKLAEQLHPFVNALNKGKEVERKRILKLQNALDRTKEGWKEQNELLNIEYTEKLQLLIDESNEKKKGKMINCPEFKLDDFIAKEDFTRTISLGQGNTKDIPIKKGQALLPSSFFKLMGDLISE